MVRVTLVTLGLESDSLNNLTKFLATAIFFRILKVIFHGLENHIYFSSAPVLGSKGFWFWALGSGF